MAPMTRSRSDDEGVPPEYAADYYTQRADAGLIENGALDIGYVGTQFALAVLVVLVPDGAFGIDVRAGLSRLIGIVVGIALLHPVRHLVDAWRGRASR